MSPAWIVATITFVPLVALIGTYFWSATSGEVPWCIPMIEGCTSISQAARRGSAIYLFRGLMMPYAAFLIIFWIYLAAWLKYLGDQSISPAIIRFLGIAAAIALVIYLDFLGTEGRVYNILRRQGVIFYFALTGFAQFMTIARIEKLESKIPSLKRLRKCLFIIALLMLAFAIFNLYVALAVHDRFSLNNAIEWNYSILMHLYFLILWTFWRRPGVYLLKINSNIT
jgi:hypothetical protein